MDYVQPQQAGDVQPHAHKRTTAFQFWLRRQNWSFLYWHSLLLIVGFCAGVVFLITAPLVTLPIPGLITYFAAFLCTALLAAYVITSPFAFGIALVKKYAPSAWVAGFAITSVFFVWLVCLIANYNVVLACFLLAFNFIIGGLFALAYASSALREIPQTLKEPDKLGCLTVHGVDEATQS